MRKWLWIGTLSVALGGAGGYWYFTQNTVVTNSGRRGAVVATVIVPERRQRAKRAGRRADLGGWRRVVKDWEFWDEIGMQPPIPVRVNMAPGMQQPPRPDRIAGTVPRMPYADEEDVLALPRDPMKRLLEPTPLSKLNLFKDLTEESEPQDANPPMPDYHHDQQYCPYQGGHCPVPLRTMPRD